MLQAYATINMLESRGVNYELVQYQKKYSFYEKIKQLPRLFNGILLNDKKEALIKRLGKKNHPEFAANDAVRMSAFERFKETHFTKLSQVFVGYKKLCEGASEYSAVISGSDQLWSPAGLPTNYYNLMFVPDQVRKISIASSFGVKCIPWYQKSRTRAYLNRIDYISMREDRGRDIVKELTGKTVPVILDPVFYFNEDEWKKLIPEKKEFQEPYIFAYFLGNNDDHRNAVKNVAKKLGKKIVALRHLDQYVECDETFGDYAPYDVGPDNFLNILRGADYICTDSFHGSVFSIIHHKPFVVFNRYNENSKHSKNSRIDSLCNNLGLGGQRFSTSARLYEQLMTTINYQDVEKKLNILKQETNDYLDDALNGIE